jgi:aryl-alcohol dehydrogenase-like predicted oxidoreductase
MKKVELASGIFSSALGFGCAPIMGSVDSATAKKALEVAYDVGITHFDLARSYGYGEAEHFVGNVFSKRRDKIIIASKCGIKANWKAQLLRPIKPLIRTLLANKKKNQPLVQESTNRVADRFHDRILLTSKEITLSLEESLKALNTDYLDFYFIHEPIGKIDNIEEIIGLAEKFKKAGKIRAFGLATVKSDFSLHEDYLNLFDVIQFNNAPGSEEYQKTVIERQHCSNIFFSPFKGGDRDITPVEKLRMLMSDFPKSVTLCSMFNEKHIIENANVLNTIA